MKSYDILNANLTNGVNKNKSTYYKYIKMCNIKNVSTLYNSNEQESFVQNYKYDYYIELNGKKNYFQNNYLSVKWNRVNNKWLVSSCMSSNGHLF